MHVLALIHTNFFLTELRDSVNTIVHTQHAHVSSSLTLSLSFSLLLKTSVYLYSRLHTGLSPGRSITLFSLYTTNWYHILVTKQYTFSPRIFSLRIYNSICPAFPAASTIQISHQLRRTYVIFARRE